MREDWNLKAGGTAEEHGADAADQAGGELLAAKEQVGIGLVEKLQTLKGRLKRPFIEWTRFRRLARATGQAIRLNCIRIFLLDDLVLNWLASSCARTDLPLARELRKQKMSLLRWLNAKVTG